MLDQTMMQYSFSNSSRTFITCNQHALGKKNEKLLDVTGEDWFFSSLVIEQFENNNTAQSWNGYNFAYLYRQRLMRVRVHSPA